MKILYYDRFANEYTDKRDPIAPPERYFVVCQSHMPDCYIEFWKDDDERFAFAYNEIEIKNGVVEQKRKIYADNHGFELESAQLYEWHIVKVKFDEIVKAYGLQPIEL